MVGPGRIAERFANAMQVTEGGEIRAVASRSMARADSYADRFGVSTRYGSYEDLAADPEVDVVYVATLPSTHLADTLLFLEAGKHVLCEKPFALDVAQARQMADVARSKGLFLMEAMWSRFLPAWRIVVDLVGEGRIGSVRVVEASLGFPFPADSRVFDLAGGGGSLLDLGVYPVTLCTAVLGQPESTAANGVLGSTGVDELCAAVMRHPEGALGLVSSATTVGLPCAGRIAGTGGVIEIPAMVHCPDRITVVSGRGIEEMDCSFDGDGIRFELDEVHRCLTAGKTESKVVPLDHSIGVMATLDAIRDQVGVVYPRA